MPTHPEAVRLNLEFYRKAAKALLKGARSGDAESLKRMAERPLALNQAQLTIAREQGFPSWARFKTFLVESALDFQGLVKEFVNLAVDDGRRAEEMLARHPALADAGVYTALVLGDVTRVEKATISMSKGGPLEWEPLLYVCFSRMANQAGLTETARLLLSRGADPNSSHLHPDWPNSPLPCLYGATGLNNNPALARLLLDAGARVDDGESLYHSTEHPDLECVRLLLERGASTRVVNVLNHMLDYESLAGVRMLLAAGADPSGVNQRGETSLHWAVWRGRSAAIIGEMVKAGATIEARRSRDGRTAYAIAVQSGQMETAALLASLGANTELSEFDRFVGACAAASPEEVDRMAAGIQLPEEYARLMPDLASSHCTSAVRGLLAAGVPVDARGEHGGTSLHWACWKGHADLVKLLLDHGASLAIEDEAFHATPVGWLSHGVRNCGERGDYAAAARLLAAAGAVFKEGDYPTGDAEVDAVAMGAVRTPSPLRQ